MNTGPFHKDDAPESDAPSTSSHFERLREKVLRSRAQQFGLGGIFVFTALMAIALAFLRNSDYFVFGVLAPSTVLLGLAVSVTGVPLLVSSLREKSQGRERLARTYLRWGLACLLLGLPGGIGLAFAMVAINRM